MGDRVRLLICSDIHYAGTGEKQRVDYEIKGIPNPAQRLIVRMYRRFVWLRDPFAHNHLLEQVLKHPLDPDLVIANGDFSCDSAFVGVSDAASLESAQECLGQLRGQFGKKLIGVIGDHELGKQSLCGGHGGLRLESFEVAQTELALKPIWTQRVGKYVMLGVTSSLLAMSVYEKETLVNERGQWREWERQHRQGIEAVFRTLEPDEKVLLFCHDPTALPYLWELEEVRKRVKQIERTIIGHLHSELLMNQSRMLSGIPRIGFCGAAVRRMSTALSKARTWKHFNLLLCPSLAGIELNRKGGFYFVELDPSAKAPAVFQLQTIRR